MTVIEIRDAAGTIVWTSPEAGEVMYETVDNTVRVTEFDTGQVIATYALKPGEQVVK
jgi:hypothetical protein